MARSSLDRDGFRLRYDVVGRGRPVLLTHGFAASSHMFERTVDALAGDHMVITWDLRGHAGSDHPDDPAAYSVPLAVGDMVALLDAVGVERAVALGHSVGGYLTLELHLARPDRLDGIVLVDTGPGYRRDEARAAWNDTAERYAATLAEHGLDGLPTSDELRRDVHPTAVGLRHAALGLLRQHDGRVLASLPTIAVPTLIVVGSGDEPYLDASRHMAAKIPGAELAVIDGAGHAPPVSHPDRFNERLRTFLASIPADLAQR